jgi:hypothetical protein
MFEHVGHVADLGQPEEISRVIVDFQKYLYDCAEV